MYLVSIIVPIFNGEHFLKKCLDSLVNQSLKNIEIICIDDGSTDNTLLILNDYASNDSRIKVITTQNKGQGSARNIGLREAKGEYISFVDADDWIREDALELLYNRAKYDNLDMVIFQMINFIESSKKYVETDLYNHKCFEENFLDENIIFNHDDTEDFLFEIPVCPVSKLYKRDFLKSHNASFPEGIFFEDNAFFYNIYFKCKRIGFVKQQLYYRRRHENSVTQKIDKKKFDIVKATNKVLEIFLENKQYSIYKKNLINHTFSMLLEWFKKYPLEFKDEFFNLIKKDFKGFNSLKLDFKNNLKEEYLIMFINAEKNENYLDFLSEYKLSISDYDIYDNGNYYSLNSDKYMDYKSNISKKNKISVIIPIYNNEKIIHRTLMSIENQSFGIENIEVLMVNDASEDNTKDVLNYYADKYDNFKAIHIKRGTGSPGTPRNIGLMESTADYVIFLDHDDYFDINALDKLYGSITQLNCDFVYGTYVSVDEGLATKIIYPNEYHGYFENIFDNPRSIAFPPPSIWTKLFKRDFLIKNNILFPTILGEDAIFISKALFKANGVAYLWDDLICYHDLSKLSSTKNISYDYLIEGFVSEEYLYKLYDLENPFSKDLNDFDNNIDFYSIRAEGILDFYLNQFYLSDLNKDQINSIFPLLYDFVERINAFGFKPHVYNHNIILFDYILNKDIKSIIKFKQEKIMKNNNDKKVPNNIKVKSFIKRISVITKTYPILKKIKSKL